THVRQKVRFVSNSCLPTYVRACKRHAQGRTNSIYSHNSCPPKGLCQTHASQLMISLCHFVSNSCPCQTHVSRLILRTYFYYVTFLAMLLFAVLTLPPTYHVEVAA